MSLDAFERAATGRHATVERTTVDDFGETLAAHLDGPTVGTPLPFEGVSLEPHPVTLRPTPAELDAATVGVTPVGPAVAEYGSVVLASDNWGAEQVSIYPETHVGVLAASDVVPTLEDAVERIAGAVGDGLTSAVLTTGPSATADMGAPVYGAHGPANLHVLVLEDR
ncbi:LUD domain-containing protein [Halogeometricum limi]|uniref:L-lactate dehydrogenase complex protein LldG n=1 Tax=Halogeometricum limi TaxID=555875 RepID=A0A1I6IBB6_9EURY|nr:LUD domain-containing protein [Halogeometricum limi]SFR63966.1 L-lactate dehydrogenase complex protein LldG [Halogeometricum limi]